MQALHDRVRTVVENTHLFKKKLHSKNRRANLPLTDTAQMYLQLPLHQCTEMHFASLLSGGFTTMVVINPPEKKLANHTSVQWGASHV